jgi:serine/threonine-protein kinase ATR
MQGMIFDTPERVPFRLTHNMVDAMGITGIEGAFNDVMMVSCCQAIKNLSYTPRCIGVYRRSCEVTMKILRLNRDTLMSVLETFIHDPLVEWSQHKSRPKSSSAAHHNDGEIANEQGKKVLQTIDTKLQGGFGPQFYAFNASPALSTVLSSSASLLSSNNTTTPLGISPLSVEGQVHELIQTAVDLDKLSQMWIGWAAYL